MHKAETRLLLVGGELNEFRRIEALLAAARGSHFDVRWCEHFDAAGDVLQSEEFDALLLDCQRDPEPAFKLLQQLNERGCGAPILAITRTVDCPSAQVALSLGASDFLSLDKLDSYVLQRCIGYAVDKHLTDQKLQQLNLSDPLTGVANRLLFLQKLDQAVKQGAEQQSQFALMIINLDGFTEINNRYGSERGDQLVVRMAQRLSRCVRKSDLIARVGADEFTLILEDCHTREDVQLVAAKVIDVLAEPYPLDGQSIIASCSVGVAVFPEAADHLEGILKAANTAMLSVKAQRGSNFALFAQEAHVDAALRSDLSLAHPART